MTPKRGKLLFTRTNGEHFIYRNTVSSDERLEMIYRSIGRQYDWDLEKYRVSFSDFRTLSKISIKETREDLLRMSSDFSRTPLHTSTGRSSPTGLLKEWFSTSWPWCWSTKSNFSSSDHRLEREQTISGSELATTLTETAARDEVCTTTTLTFPICCWPTCCTLQPWPAPSSLQSPICRVPESTSTSEELTASLSN